MDSANTGSPEMGSAEDRPADAGTEHKPVTSEASADAPKTDASKASDSQASDNQASDIKASEMKVEPSAPELGAGIAAHSMAAEAAKDAAKETSPDVTAKDAGKDIGKEAAKEAAKPRPGSSLILIPPVTRSAGAQASAPKPDASTTTSAGASSFAAARNARRPRISKDTMLRYGIPGALALCLFGAGIATGGQFFGGSTTAVPSAAATATAPAAVTAAMPAAKPVHLASTDQSELRHLIKKLTDEVHTLQSRVEAMRSTSPTASTEEIRSLKKSIEALRASYDSNKAEQGATIAVLSAKVDRLQRDEAKLGSGEKTVRADKAVAPAPTTTASVAKPVHVAAATPVETAAATPAAAKPPATATASTDPKKKADKLLVNWVVRDVYRGVALVDGPDGSLEVSRGDPIPGAGTVESIERRNGGWVLVTSRGIVASVRNGDARGDLHGGDDRF